MYRRKRLANRTQTCNTQLSSQARRKNKDNSSNITIPEDPKEMLANFGAIKHNFITKRKRKSAPDKFQSVFPEGSKYNYLIKLGGLNNAERIEKLTEQLKKVEEMKKQFRELLKYYKATKRRLKKKAKESTLKKGKK